MAPPSTPDQHPHSAAFDKMVVIEVGSTSQTGSTRKFQMHQGILRFYSQYFDDMLKGDTGQAIELPDEEPEIFAIFQDWAYRRRLCHVSRAEEDLAWTTLVKLWIFGSKKGVPLLQNHVNDIILSKALASGNAPWNEVTNVYRHTAPNDSLRKLIIDIFGRLVEKNEENKLGLNKHFTKEGVIDLLDVAWKQMAGWTEEDLKDLDLCRYHDHEEGMKCVKVER